MSREIQRDFIVGVLRDLEGYVPMGHATGRSKSGKLEIKATEWFHYPSDLEKMIDFAEQKRSGDRANTYLGPSTYGNMEGEKGKRSRSIENALECQTIYMDSDSCPPEAFRIEPSRHVNTSPGHGHDYWFLVEPIPTKEAAEIARRIGIAHREQGADPTGWSANKFLRLPTVNTSYNTQDPYKITYHDTGEVFEPGEISETYSDIEVDQLPEMMQVEGQEFGSVPPIADLPDAMKLIERIPSSERNLNELIYKVPKSGEEGWASEQRWSLLLELMRYGFTPEETVSIAWNCPAAQKWREDQRGIDGLWWEARRAGLVIKAEREKNEQEPDDYEAPEQVVKREKLKLVTPAQRKLVAELWGFREQYMDWCRMRVPVFNDPYHAIAAWTILALAYGEYGYIPKEGGEMWCNIYSNTIGESSSGKSEAKKLQVMTQDAIFRHDSPDIGSDFSKNALVETLIERDGKVSWIHADEAHGVYRIWKANGGGWTTGIQETYTLVYDGPVPSQGRVGKKIQHGITAIPTMQMTGTPEGMFDVLDRSMFLEGYLARTIWVIGKDIPMTRESMVTKQVTMKNTRTFYRAMPNYWASVIDRNRNDLVKDLPIGERAAPLLMTDEALEMYGKAKGDLLDYFNGLDDPGLFTTARNRLFDIVWKVCGLLAMSEGSSYITTTHVTQALVQTETWVESLVYVADRIQNSVFSKACDDVEKFIASRHGREVEVAAIYQKFRSEDVYQINRYIDSLQKQNRLVERRNDKTKTTYYRLPKPKEEDSK